MLVGSHVRAHADICCCKHLLAVQECLLAKLLLQIFLSQNRFVLLRLHSNVSLHGVCTSRYSSWQVPALWRGLDSLDVWVIKSACGAQQAANTLNIALCVCSLTERAQLLKNVFKKSTVSLYRSDSMQQNLLRKLPSNLFFLCFVLSHPYST